MVKHWWLRGPPWDVTSCIFMDLGAFKQRCELNIFNFQDEEPPAIRKYQNAEPQLLGLDGKKWIALKFSALQKQWGFILGSDKTPVPPSVLTHWECLGGEVASLHEPALGAIAGSKKEWFIFQKKIGFWSKQTICKFRLDFIAEQRRYDIWNVFKSSKQNILCETKCCIQF